MDIIPGCSKMDLKTLNGSARLMWTAEALAKCVKNEPDEGVGVQCGIILDASAGCISDGLIAQTYLPTLPFPFHRGFSMASYIGFPLH